MDHANISVVIPEFKLEHYHFVCDCIESIQKQDYVGTYEIVVILEDQTLYEKVTDTYNQDDITVHHIENEDGGVSVARNKGYEFANYEIVAYIDSDATANENWLTELNKTYQTTDNCISVGGKAKPKWETKRPSFLPNEYLWLVGVTHEGHPPSGSSVRSTFGCNMSFQKSVLETVGGFDDSVGKDHGYNLQGEEPELGIRIYKEYDQQMIYTDQAIIYHTVESEQCTMRWLSNRAYLQGVTKAFIEDKHAQDELDTENNYLKYLFMRSIPKYISSIPNQPIDSSIKLVSLLWFTFLVFLGYTKIKLFE